MKILLVDEDDPAGDPVKQRLASDGYGVVEANDAQSATAIAEREVPDLVLLDVRLPNGNGLLQGLKQRDPELPVIIITSSASVDQAVEALKLGAFAYVAKPFHLDALAQTVQRALDTAQLRRALSLHVREHKARYGIANLLGETQAMRGLRSLVAKVARSPTATVLVRGESGTGKDLIARAVHAESERSGKPFVNITCTAMQDSLLESELFGHEKGAFTDAKALKRGLLELAHGGTVLLDELGDMSPALQGKVLRVLEERTFRRLGGTRDIRVDVRIIGATHVNLESMIERRAFREDLYYRLSAITIDAPPLRDRREDIALLTDHFVEGFARELRTVSKVSDEARAKLAAYDWPGNIRELRNVVERAVLLGTEPVLAPDDFILGRPSAPGDALSGAGKRVLALPRTGLDLAALDRDLVMQALERTSGNQTKAAELLGISRDQVHYRMQKYGLLKSTPKAE